jgi:hypothetical protein
MCRLRYIIIGMIWLTSQNMLGQKRSFLTPDFIVLQYAGSIGYYSAGAGYDIFKSRGRMSFHFGSVPKSSGGPLNIVTGKVFYEPWQIRLSEKAHFNPLDIGMIVSYHMGDDFKMNVPDYLSSDNYYWWHTCMRLHLAVETSVTAELKPNRFFKRFTGYAECNTNDLYMVSYFKNASTLKAYQLIKVGIGGRFNF